MEKCLSRATGTSCTCRASVNGRLLASAPTGRAHDDDSNCGDDGYDCDEGDDCDDGGDDGDGGNEEGHHDGGDDGHDDDEEEERTRKSYHVLRPVSCDCVVFVSRPDLHGL